MILAIRKSLLLARTKRLSSLSQQYTISFVNHEKHKGNNNVQASRYPENRWDALLEGNACHCDRCGQNDRVEVECLEPLLTDIQENLGEIVELLLLGEVVELLLHRNAICTARSVFVRCHLSIVQSLLETECRITITVWDDIELISQHGNNNMSNETQWVVKYKLPGDQVRTPREIIVTATNQSDAKKVGQAMIPEAIILGGPQPLR